MIAGLAVALAACTGGASRTTRTTTASGSTTTAASTTTTAAPVTTTTRPPPRPKGSVTFAFGGDVHFEAPLRSALAADPTAVLAAISPTLQQYDIAL